MVGPVNPYNWKEPEQPPDSGYLNEAKDYISQALKQKWGSMATLQNIGAFSPELSSLIQEFIHAPTQKFAEEVFQQIQLALETPSGISAGQITPSAINNLVEQFMQQAGFSGSVMVVQNGNPIFSQGYGEASAGVANSADTTYRWDSVTKLITATAILQLSEKGSLNLNAPITTYLPQYSNPQKYPGFAGQPPVTIISLLNMTSGIAECPSSPPSNWQTPPSLQNIMDYVAGQPRSGQGTFAYRNSGYNLLAAVIGRLTEPSKDAGVAFSDYLQKNIFSPAGMTTATAPSTVGEDTPDAESHIYDQNGNPEAIGTNQWPDYTSLRIGAGNVNGSIWDFEKFTSALNSGKLISMKDVALMRDERLGGWDPGQQSINGQDFLSKGGQQDGEQSYYMQFPDNTMVFITANIAPKDQNNGRDHIQFLAQEIAALLYPSQD
jgi:CubicO group peptidase (beta-lactamase class C family)